MNILLLTSEFAPATGGIGTYSREIASAAGRASFIAADLADAGDVKWLATEVGAVATEFASSWGCSAGCSLISNPPVRVDHLVTFIACQFVTGSASPFGLPKF